MKYVFGLGAHPVISEAEIMTRLLRLGYSPTLSASSDYELILDLDKELPDKFIDRLGGCVKIGRLLGKQDHLWTAPELKEVLSPTPPKFKLGISGIDLPPDYAKQTGFALKKLLREDEVKIKFVLAQGKGGQLNAAQIIFNKLNLAPNVELNIFSQEGVFYLAKTEQVQDIQAYERRDNGRPVRDAMVGMLPPRLAQMMLNLVPYSTDKPVVLDPFCGLGTVLQEGHLMGFEMIGSDSSERMIEASHKNMNWLAPADKFNTFQHDARKPFPTNLNERIDAVVTEPFLGDPISTTLPQREALARLKMLSAIYADFFKNMQPMLKKDGYVMISLPALKVDRDGDDFILQSPAFIDAVENLGYSLVQPGERGEWLYARPDALVGRELSLFKYNGT